MKTRKKALLLSFCAVLLIATSLFGTTAYLTSVDSVTNTFTVGKVTFGDGDAEEGLDEANVNEYGDPVDADGAEVELSDVSRGDANTYKLVPGHTCTKDPTVHINNESEACYIFVKVKNEIADIEVAAADSKETIEEQILRYGWTKLGTRLNVESIYWKLWKDPIVTEGDKNSNTSDLPIFDSFTVRADVDAATLEGYADAKIAVTAYAIQADGFENNVADAWVAVSGEPLFSKDVYGTELPKYATTAGTEQAIRPRNGGYQVVIETTTEEEYNQYVELLKTSGFDIYSEKNIEGNLFHTFTTDNLHVFLGWNPYAKVAIIVYQEPGNLPALEKPIVTAEDNVPMSISHPAITDPEDGMSYVIQIKDGSFIVIDGGMPNATDMETLYKLLKEMTPEGDDTVIETWMFTHPDTDHIGLAKGFIRAYADQVKINSFAYNFVDNTVFSQGAAEEQVITDLKKNIAECYPEAVTYTLHAGQTYYYKGVEVEILQTVEERYNAKAPTSHNAVSAAWRMTFDNGKTFLVLGDCQKSPCTQLYNSYGNYLKSDILQVAHHGLAGGTLDLYKAIDPDVCFWDINETRFSTDGICLGTRTGYEYNAWIRDDLVRVREHYHGSVTTTLLIEE